MWDLPGSEIEPVSPSSAGGFFTTGPPGQPHILFMGFPGSSDGKEPTCNEGDLGWEDPLEKDMATHSSVLAWRIPMDRGAWRATVHGVAESDTTEQLSTAQQVFEHLRQNY